MRISVTEKRDEKNIREQFHQFVWKDDQGTVWWRVSISEDVCLISEHFAPGYRSRLETSLSTACGKRLIEGLRVVLEN